MPLPGAARDGSRGSAAGVLRNGDAEERSDDRGVSCDGGAAQGEPSPCPLGVQGDSSLAASVAAARIAKSRQLAAFRDSDAIRTRDPQLRRLLLYPAELRNQADCKDSKKIDSSLRSE